MLAIEPFEAEILSDEVKGPEEEVEIPNPLGAVSVIDAFRGVRYTPERLKDCVVDVPPTQKLLNDRAVLGLKINVGLGACVVKLLVVQPVAEVPNEFLGTTRQ